MSDLQIIDERELPRGILFKTLVCGETFLFCGDLGIKTGASVAWDFTLRDFRGFVGNETVTPVNIKISIID